MKPLLAHTIEVVTGVEFGRWKVCGVPFSIDGRRVVKATCLCGTEKNVRVSGLLGGRSRSCGCLHKETVKRILTTHGHCSKRYGTSPEFRSWDHMIQRCTNPNNDQYHDYGGRGVYVCDAWLHSFSAFLLDMGRRPDGCSLDRVDDSLVYSKDTCRWATRRQQADNRRCTRWVRIRGEKISLAELSDRTGIGLKTLSGRWDKGLRDIELCVPVKSRTRKVTK